MKSSADLQILMDPYALVVEECIGEGKKIENNGAADRLTISDIFHESNKRQYIYDWIQGAGPDSFPLQMEAKVALNGSESHWYDLVGTYNYSKVYITGKNIDRQILSWTNAPRSE